MDVRILDSLMVGVVCGVALSVEVVYLVVAHLMLRPSKKETASRLELAQANLDKSRIKSVQLQLVESSKLERRINNNEKKLDKFNEARVPQVQLVANVLNVVKLVVYLVFCLEYTHPSAVVFKMKSDLLWPYRAAGVVYYLAVWQVCPKRLVLRAPPLERPF